MKTQLISSCGSRRLILFYLGWANDPSPFASLSRPGYDIMAAWDYTSLEFDATAMRAYDEIVVVAWSFGVFAAAATANHLPVPVTCRIAVAGTLTPVDDLTGIPEKIFWGTLAALGETAMRKFVRRMCRDNAQYEEYMRHPPRRSVADCTAELEAVPRHMRDNDITSLGKRWDYALIPQDDRVFPPENQKRAWETHATSVVSIAGGHLPAMSRVLENYVIDKELVKRRFGRAASSYANESSIQEAMAAGLCENLATLAPDVIGAASFVLEAGSGTGHLTNRLAAMLPRECQLLLWDVVDFNVPRPDNALFEQQDAEIAIRTLPYRSYDMVVSGATIQWFNSPGAFLQRATRVLKPGGILAFSTFARGNLREVSDIVGDNLPFIAYGHLDSLVPPDTEVLMMKQSSVTRYFPSPQAVLEHLRLSGVNAVASQSRPVETIHRFIRTYPRVWLGPHKGECPLTYTPLYVVLKKKIQ